MRILLTGADGFLGRHLTRTFLAKGWRVDGLVRDPQRKPPPAEAGVRYYHYGFPADIDSAAFAEPVDVLVHGAFNMKASPTKYGVNREAVEFLQRGKYGRFLFISSMSAHRAAESLYGREKLYIEGTLDASRDLAIRPGFIIGDGGVFSNLVRSIKSLPVIPLFYGGWQPIQTVYVDDLCSAIASGIERGTTGVVSYGEQTPILLRDFYRAIAKGLGVSRLLLPMPGGLTCAGLRIAESLGVPLPMTSQNLLGLKHLIKVDVAQDIARLGAVRPRAMAESLATCNWSML